MKRKFKSVKINVCKWQQLLLQILFDACGYVHMYVCCCSEFHAFLSAILGYTVHSTYIHKYVVHTTNACLACWLSVCLVACLRAVCCCYLLFFSPFLCTNAFMQAFILCSYVCTHLSQATTCVAIFYTMQPNIHTYLY